MFETTPQALIKLKGAGVPESLLLLMLEVSNGAPAPVRDSQPPGRQQLRMPVPPKIVYQPELRYPELAQRENVEGMVVLDVTIVKEGMVSDIRVISSPHPVLTEEAVKNVNQWRFESPAVADEKTDVVSTVSIRFALN
jgi:TonB family protein